MSRHFLRPAVTAAGALALVAAVGATSAQAEAPAPGIVAGTGTIFMSKAYIANMAAGNIVITAQNPISVTSQSTFTTTIWNLAGGTPDLAACTGTVQLAAGSLVTNTVTGASVLLNDITFDLATDTIDYTVSTPHGVVTIEGLKLEGVQGGFDFGGYGTYSASEVFLTPGASAALDNLTGTDAFMDTNVFGAFTTTFKLSGSDGHFGPVSCG